jgi:CDP-glycerol glycerophosphotransferase
VIGVAARISVVVPVYNVAPYLEACLGSLARQTVRDLEIVLVNDGSTDTSPQIAEGFVSRDSRFRLVHQDNAGLGAARNTGVRHASGEFLVFVDSDDLVPAEAYELLLAALDETGSDFACGDVRRFTSSETSRVGFLTRAFERRRLRTHVTRFPPLVADRMAWNKLFRRSFWDAHGFRFPEGVFYEDIPVTLPAHYLARSVDVIRQPVYLWRRREGVDLSLSQRRTELKALRDRVAAVDYVSRFLEEQGLFVSKAFYERSALGHDLRYFLDALPRGGEEFRRLFIELTNEFIVRADAWALDLPFAIDRLKWELVRRRALPELLEVLRFEDEELLEAAPVRRGRHWYADYPYRADERLRIPERVYRLDTELAPIFRVNRLRWEDDKLRIEGWAYVTMIGAPEPGSQSVALVARRRGSRRRLRLQTEPVYRPDVTAMAAQEFASLDWAGFAATVDARDLIRGAGDTGTWDFGVVIRAGGVTRTTWKGQPAPLHANPSAETTVNGRPVAAALSPAGKLTVEVGEGRPCLRAYVVDEGVVELEGDAGSSVSAADGLKLVRRTGARTLSYPLYVDRASRPRTFLARVPLVDLLSAPDEDLEDEARREKDGAVWDVQLGEPDRLAPLAFPSDVPEWKETMNGREVALERSGGGSLALAERPSRAVIKSVGWSGEKLVLAGSLLGPPADYRLVLRASRHGQTIFGDVGYDADAGRFAAETTPGSLSSVTGARPLPAGLWDIVLVADGLRGQPPILAGHLLDGLPASAEIDGKRFHVGVGDRNAPVLAVERDLDDGERGGFAQRRLRSSVYRRHRGEPLRDVVVYECFDGRSYSDSPRAIHEELCRRQAPFEHLWVVQDAAFEVRATARPLRHGSQEYYEALARARYVVANDYWPRWFVRRPGQTCLQTWHGGPLKHAGLALADRPKAVRAYRRALSQRPENWELVLSPAPLSTPVIRSAFPVGDVLETGLPRTDLLFAPDRERVAEEVRARLGISGRRVVLYAPTYLDHLEYRSLERLDLVREVSVFAADSGYGDAYRQPELLDLVALREGLDDDHVVLFRKHRRVLDRLPPRAAASVLDVSEYPDVMELLLVADILVTDYSSIVFDYISTGRPIVFFTPGLADYRDDVRGFSIDFEAVAPAPLLATTDEVVDAVRDPEAVRAGYRERYEAFAASYCALTDGQASKRVVDRVFEW